MTRVQPQGTIVLSPNGRRVGLAQGPRIRVYDIEEPRLRLRYACEASAPVTSLAFATDGDLLLSGARDGSVAIWEVDRTAKPTYVFKSHTERVRALMWSDSEGLLASGGDDGTLVLYGVDGVVKSRYVNGSAIRTVALTLGACVLTGDADGALRLWTPFDDEPIDKRHFDSGIERIATSGPLIACVTDTGVWSVWKGEESLHERRMRVPPTSMHFHPRQLDRLGIAEDRRVETVSIGHPTRLQHRVEASFAITDFAWTKDGDLVLLGFENGKLLVACGAATLRVPFEMETPID